MANKCAIVLYESFPLSDFKSLYGDEFAQTLFSTLLRWQREELKGMKCSTWMLQATKQGYSIKHNHRPDWFPARKGSLMSLLSHIGKNKKRIIVYPLSFFPSDDDLTFLQEGEPPVIIEQSGKMISFALHNESSVELKSLPYLRIEDFFTTTDPAMQKRETSGVNITGVKELVSLIHFWGEKKDERRLTELSQLIRRETRKWAQKRK